MPHSSRSQAGGGGSTDVSLLAKDASFQPISQTGTITTTNGNVELSTLGRDTAAIQITGTYTGVLSIQYTVDNTNWVKASGAQTLINKATGAYTATVASGTQGIFITSVDGVQKIRVIGLAAVTGTATVTIRAVDGNGLIALDNALPAGSAVIGAVTQSGAWMATTTPATPSNYNLVTAATTNAAFLKASAGSLFEVTVSNVTATDIYVKFYNKASAPTVGTDVPVLTLKVALGTTLSIKFGAVGKRVLAGIAIAATAAAVHTDTGVAVAGVQVNATYI